MLRILLCVAAAAAMPAVPVITTLPEVPQYSIIYTNPYLRNLALKPEFIPIGDDIKLEEPLVQSRIPEAPVLTLEAQMIKQDDSLQSALINNIEKELATEKSEPETPLVEIPEAPMLPELDTLIIQPAALPISSDKPAEIAPQKGNDNPVIVEADKPAIAKPEVVISKPNFLPSWFPSINLPSLPSLSLPSWINKFPLSLSSLSPPSLSSFSSIFSGSDGKVYAWRSPYVYEVQSKTD